jgi:AraC-like DNA-binding protein
MAKTSNRDSAPSPNQVLSCDIEDERSQGLYRTTIAGPGRNLVEAFDAVVQCPRVGRIFRHSKRDLLSARVTLTPEEGQGYWELIRIRTDLYVILANFAYAEPRFEIVPGDDLIQFNFKISGDLNYGAGLPDPLRFNRPSLHIWRQPAGIDMREWTAAGAQERMVAISVRPQYLADQWLDNRDVPVPLAPFLAAPGKDVDYCLVPLTAKMMQMMSDLLESPYRDSLYLVNAESLAQRLLCEAIANLEAPSGHPLGQRSDWEINALGQARQMLMNELADAPTLRSLSRAVGLTEKALTSGFKTVYGETVLDFGIRCRMQHAMHLLRDRHWSVDRASEAVGYSHPTSFATAFRRYFGLSPIDVKQLKGRGKG